VVRVAFRVDANALMGGGHAMRCLALADALRACGAETIFLSAVLPEALAQRIARAGHRTLIIPPSAELDRKGPGWEASALSRAAQEDDATATANALGGCADWLVVDHYLLDRSWEQAARTNARRIMVLDDLANRPHDCDLLLDQSLGREAGEYRPLAGPSTKLLLGPLYALLRPEFARERPAALQRRRVPEPVKRILISLGATDVGGHTLPAACAAVAADSRTVVDVVIGGAAPSLTELEALARGEPRLHLHVDTGEMARLMRDADLAIGASGSTSWERCCLGLPAIAVVLADNQRLVAERLAESGAAEVASGMDALGGLLKSLIGDPARRLCMTAAAAALTEGLGVDRVLGEMLPSGEPATAAPVEIRPASRSDSEPLWLWRNDPLTRKASRSADPVPWPDHAAWLERTLAEDDRHLLIAERRGEPIGMVRFDRLPGDVSGFEVSINVRPDARGGGSGKAVLEAGCRYWMRRQGQTPLEAVVHETNSASRRIFEALGFVHSCPMGETGFHRYVRPKDAPLAGAQGVKGEHQR
jgi:UDP-2,4-diacetamido-2,4,6-trideoxy-beta-L-altropyranose hydrolase